MAATTIAQISDLHITMKRSAFLRRGDPGDALARCIAALNAIQPDVVIATGDLAHAGSPEEYLRLRELLAESKAPVFLLPGNHDDREALRKAFPDSAYLFETPSYIAYALDVGPIRIIAFDSTDPPKIGGYLDELRLSWLRAQLEEADSRPTVLALHHPPFKTGVWPMDSFAFTNGDVLARMIKENPHIRRVITGHVHCAQAVQWEETIACTCPTPWSQPLLRSIGGGPLRPVIERGGFLLHSLDGGGRITTRAVRLNGAIDHLH